MIASTGIDSRPPLSCVGSLLKRKRPGPVEKALSTSLLVQNATNCGEDYSCRGKDMQRNDYFSGDGDLSGKGNASHSNEEAGKKKKKKKNTGTKQTGK